MLVDAQRDRGTQNADARVPRVRMPGEVDQVRELVGSRSDQLPPEVTRQNLLALGIPHRCEWVDHSVQTQKSLPCSLVWVSHHVKHYVDRFVLGIREGTC